jgi:hypothetical protein
MDYTGNIKFENDERFEKWNHLECYMLQVQIGD